MQVKFVVDVDFSKYLRPLAQQFIKGEGDYTRDKIRAITRCFKFFLPQIQKTYHLELKVNFLKKTIYWINREARPSVKYFIITALACTLIGLIPILIGSKMQSSTDQQIGRIRNNIFKFHYPALEDRIHTKIFDSLWNDKKDYVDLEDGIDHAHGYKNHPFNGCARIGAELETMLSNEENRQRYACVIKQKTDVQLI